MAMLAPQMRIDYFIVTTIKYVRLGDKAQRAYMNKSRTELSRT